MELELSHGQGRRVLLSSNCHGQWKMILPTFSFNGERSSWEPSDVHRTTALKSTGSLQELHNLDRTPALKHSGRDLHRRGCLMESLDTRVELCHPMWSSSSLDDFTEEDA